MDAVCVQIVDIDTNIPHFNRRCTLCGEAFADEKTIKKHITTFHFNELTDNSCRICGKQCKDQRSLLKHAWDHSKEKKHACVNCGKNFHNKARLRRHMQSHRNKSVTCNICGDVFADGRSLMNHRHSHTNISGRQFPCRECGKTFGSRSSQQIHMRIHTGMALINRNRITSHQTYLMSDFDLFYSCRRTSIWMPILLEGIRRWRHATQTRTYPHR